MTIKAMKVEGPIHVVCQCDKCKAESQNPVATVTSETGADLTMSWWHEPALPIGTKLFTHPPKRTEQEPRNVRERWNIELDGDDLLVCFNDHEKGDKCEYERYSPQRSESSGKPSAWVGLTDDEISACDPSEECWGLLKIAKAIEAKLKEKNS